MKKNGGILRAEQRVGNGQRRLEGKMGVVVAAAVLIGVRTAKVQG